MILLICVESKKVMQTNWLTKQTRGLKERALGPGLVTSRKPSPAQRNLRTCEVSGQPQPRPGQTPPESDTKGSRLEDPCPRCWVVQMRPEALSELTSVLRPSPTRDPARAETPPSRHRGGPFCSRCSDWTVLGAHRGRWTLESGLAPSHVSPTLWPLLGRAAGPGDDTRTHCRCAMGSHSFRSELSRQRCPGPPCRPSFQTRAGLTPWVPGHYLSQPPAGRGGHVAMFQPMRCEKWCV